MGYQGFLDRLAPHLFGLAFFTQRPEHLPEMAGHLIIRKQFVGTLELNQGLVQSP